MAAARMGAHLKRNGVAPDVIISSTANRARDTAKVIAEQLGYETDRIVYNERLFDGGPRAYLAEVNEQPETCSSVMIVGHNPDVSYFSEFLTHQDVGSMSKGSVAAITFDDLNWAEVSGRTGHLSYYIAPKQLPQ